MRGFLLAAITAVACSSSSPQDKALCVGAINNDLATMERALSEGASADAVWNLTSALGLAASNNNLDAALLLVSKSADVNMRFGIPKRVPLHNAAIGGHIEMIKLLLDSGAEVNRRNKNGRTALWYATEPIGISPPGNSKEVAEYLKSRGATL